MIDFYLYGGVFWASFIYVGLRAFQQKNVTGDKYGWVLPTSMCMAVVDVFLISTLAKHGVSWVVIPLGVGAGLGCIVAMVLHNFLHKGD